MIGQETLLKLISEQIEFGDFPRFSMFIGAEGSGKKTISLAIAYALECQRVFIEPKVDEIREMIKNCYTVQTPTLYVILDGNMSNSAKNALLKICEETPKNVYIMLLLSNNNAVPETLTSRAQRYYMQPYTPKELIQYARTKQTNVDENIIADLCETPGDVNKLLEIGEKDFYQYVIKVADNIADVTSANALKIADSIGDGEGKYDMILFLRAFKAVCGNEMKKAVSYDDVEMQMYYSAGVKVSTNILKQMQINGINKKALFDMFILDIRKEWS